MLIGWLGWRSEGMSPSTESTVLLPDCKSLVPVQSASGTAFPPHLELRQAVWMLARGVYLRRIDTEV